jgi:phospholipid-binding lipoprotein MlaA
MDHRSGDGFVCTRRDGDSAAGDISGSDGRDTKRRHAPGDPFEKLNRASFHLNDWIDRKVFAPSARSYKRHSSNGFQHVLNNFFVNLGEPVVAINDGLQLRPKRFLTTVFRFATNSTVGLAGFFDVAHQAGALHHDNGFGTTLGRYGVPAGPYLYVPLAGPSTVRDAFGFVVDSFGLDSFNWVGFKKVRVAAKLSHPAHYDNQNRIPYRNSIRLGLAAIQGVVERAGVDDDLNAIMSTATDPYSTFRSVYLQSRAKDIRESHWFHGAVPEYDSTDMPPDPADPKVEASPAAAQPSAPEAAPPAAAKPDPAPIRDPQSRASMLFLPD